MFEVGFSSDSLSPLRQTEGTIERQWWRDRRGRRECAAGSTFPGSPLPQRHFRASLHGSHPYMGFAWNWLWWDLPAAKALEHNVDSYSQLDTARWMRGKRVSSFSFLHHRASGCLGLFLDGQFFNGNLKKERDTAQTSLIPIPNVL